MSCGCFNNRRPIIVRAIVQGGPLAPQIRGVVTFTDSWGGTWVYAQINGLPLYQPSANGNPIGPFGFHLHENGICEVGDPNNPFLAAGGHWNPYNQPHGNHAGDFPVLFSNNGIAVMGFYTNKFRPLDAVGHAVIIHQNPDDYRTQPTGDSGLRLACGVVQQYNG